MKKKVSLLLALGLVCTTVLSGCGGGSMPTEPQTIADATDGGGRKRGIHGGGRGGRYSGRCSGDDVCTLTMSRTQLIRLLPATHLQRHSWQTVLKGL